jgi:hypothetical protein
LNIWNVEAREDFPSFNNVMTEEMFLILLVKGAAIDASESAKLSPASAYFKAMQSFAPSPHIPTFTISNSYNNSIKMPFSSGDILANTFAFLITIYKIY